jgi:hypothetical protein
VKKPPARKIRSGVYEYRGHRITNPLPRQWFIAANEALTQVDGPYFTLRDAKFVIDLKLAL